jgi:hypothetical protein
MRAKISSQLLIVLASISLLVASCAKDDQNKSTGTNNPPINNQIGAIVDKGPTTSNTYSMDSLNIHKMEVTLSDEQNLYDSISGKKLGVGNNVEIDFFVNNDGFIPSGVYRFSPSGSKTPFTFGNTLILLTNNDGTQGSLDVIDGEIDVNRSNNQYDINYIFKLQSGAIINGKTTGKMTYSDSY